MNYNDLMKLQGYVSGVSSKPVEVSAMDEMFGRTHADGSPCKAQSPETCPFNKTAEEGDSLKGKGVSSTPNGAGNGNPGSKRFWDYMKDLSSGETDKLMEDFDGAFGDAAAKCTFGTAEADSKSSGFLDGGKYTFKHRMTAGTPTIGKNADGEMCVTTALYPTNCAKSVAGDIDGLKAKAAEYGLSLSSDVDGIGGEENVGELDNVNSEVKGIDRDGDDYVAEREVGFSFEVSDPAKWQAFVGKYKGSVPQDGE